LEAGLSIATLAHRFGRFRLLPAERRLLVAGEAAAPARAAAQRTLEADGAGLDDDAVTADALAALS
jgi:hypothetical protein